MVAVAVAAVAEAVGVGVGVMVILTMGMAVVTTAMAAGEVTDGNCSLRCSDGPFFRIDPYDRLGSLGRL